MPDVPSDLYHVIADPTRRQLLSELAAGEHAVGDLVEALGVSQPTVSKHLRVLREAELVSIRAQGQKRFYSLEPEGLREVLDWIGTLVPQADSSSEVELQEAQDSLDPREMSAAARRQHGVGRTMEQVTERAQEIIDRFAKQRFGRRR